MSRSPRFEDTVHYRLICAALLIWWVAFLYPNLEDTNDALASAATEQGSGTNQMLVLAMTALGLYHFPRAWRYTQSREGRNLVLLALLYCGWAGASLAWSLDSALTIRRFTAFVLMLIGCWGLGAGFYSRTQDGVLTLGRHIMYGAVIATLMLLPPRLAGLSLSDILNPSFNLKDTTRPAVLTYPTGYAVLAALAVFEGLPIQRWATLAFYFAVLVFMKGRTMLGDVAAAATLLASRITLDRVLGRVLLTLGIIQTAFYGDLGTGGRVFITYAVEAYDALSPFLPWLTIGGGLKDLTSLNGRLPLWTALYDHIGTQPLIGYGFGAFWTPDHIGQVFKVTGWHAVVAHDSFLDELLATGAIGLTLFLAFWIYGMAISLRLAKYYDRTAGHLVLAWSILYLLFNTMDSVNQSFLKAPFFISITAMFAVVGCLSKASDPAMLTEATDHSAPALQTIA